MSYIKAEDILPKELLETIQQYVNGQLIYIPCKEKQEWGSNTDSTGIRVYHRCGSCGKKQEFINSGKFRVNANGKSVDVWLIYRCKKCKHSWNLTIYERTKTGKIPADLFEAFEANDSETAFKYGRDIDFLKKNNAELK